MSKTAIVSSVGLLQVQHSIVPESMIETTEGPAKVQDAYVDSAVVTLKVVMVLPGEFDSNDREPFLKQIMDKLAEVEL
jgi:hypothetical protein